MQDSTQSVYYFVPRIPRCVSRVSACHHDLKEAAIADRKMRDRDLDTLLATGYVEFALANIREPDLSEIRYNGTLASQIRVRL
jgi:predicted MarR family transcription regulator